MCKLVWYFAILVHTKFNGLLVTYSIVQVESIRNKKKLSFFFSTRRVTNVLIDSTESHHTLLMFNAKMIFVQCGSLNRRSDAFNIIKSFELNNETQFDLIHISYYTVLSTQWITPMTSFNNYYCSHEGM